MSREEFYENLCCMSWSDLCEYAYNQGVDYPEELPEGELVDMLMEMFDMGEIY